MIRTRRAALLPALALALALAPACGDGSPRLGPAGPDRLDDALFREPPAENRPYFRWWWPGGAADPQRLVEELTLLAEAGVGGVEIQTLSLGLTRGEIQRNPSMRTVGLEPHLALVRGVLDEAERLDVAVDLTLGSGWPSGGPFVREGAERQLLRSELDLVGPARFDGPLPAVTEPPSSVITRAIAPRLLGPFDHDVGTVAVVAARVVDATRRPVELAELVDLTADVADGRLAWDVPEGAWRLFAFYENRSQHNVLGALYPGAPDDARVLDHLSRAGVGELIAGLGDPWLDALGGRRPGALFVDSFELIAELPWTPDLLERFRERFGYDLTPWLPLVFVEGGESEYYSILNPSGRLAYASGTTGERVREDYEQLRSELFLERFIEPLATWTRERGVDLRLQAHGGYADVLDAYSEVDIPETESIFAGGTYDFMKLAASAAHTTGRTVVASEAFGAFARHPREYAIEDLYLLAARAVSAGVTRIVHHGYPHRYVRENGSTYYPFPGGFLTGAAFTSWTDEDHAMWPELPALHRALARTSYAMTRGTHRADVAWLHPEAEFVEEDGLSLRSTVPRRGESATSRALREAGLIYDRVSRRDLVGASATGGELVIGAARYRALLLSGLGHGAAPELLAAVERAVAAGVPVVTIGALPTRAVGWADADRRDADVGERSARLREVVRGDVQASDAGRALLEVGVVPLIRTADGGPLAFTPDARTTATGEIVLLVNESHEAVDQRLQVPAGVGRVRVLDPATGSAAAAALDRSTFDLAIDARRWQLVELTH